ncbi:MAG: hypothetical protein JNK24_06655 [Alphaproteobacteria bacterium]|nr:hypothetical protein [Alphaproteobacteria bacterium]
MTTLTFRREDLEIVAADNDLFKNGPNQNFAEIDNGGTAYLNGNNPNQFLCLISPYATDNEHGDVSPEQAIYLDQLKKTNCVFFHVANEAFYGGDSYFDQPNFYDSLWEDDDEYYFSDELWNDTPPLNLDWNDWSNLSFGEDFGVFDRPWGDAGFSFLGGPSDGLPLSGLPDLTGSLSTDNPFGIGSFSFSDLRDTASPANLWTDTVSSITGAGPDATAVRSDTVTLNLTDSAPQTSIAGGTSNFALTAADITLPAGDRADLLTLDLTAPTQTAANAPLYAPTPLSLSA